MSDRFSAFDRRQRSRQTENDEAVIQKSRLDAVDKHDEIPIEEDTDLDEDEIADGDVEKPVSRSISLDRKGSLKLQKQLEKSFDNRHQILATAPKDVILVVSNFIQDQSVEGVKDLKFRYLPYLLDVSRALNLEDLTDATIYRIAKELEYKSAAELSAFLESEYFSKRVDPFNLKNGRRTRNQGRNEEIDLQMVQSRPATMFKSRTFKASKPQLATRLREVDEKSVIEQLDSRD